MKTQVRAFVLLVTAGVLLAGCASSGSVKPDSQALRNVRTIAIVRVPNPKHYTVMNAGSPLLAMGAAGALMTVAEAKHNQKGLMGAIVRTRFSYGRQLTRELRAALRADGYRTRVITVRNKNPKKFLSDNKRLMRRGIDAVLDVEVLNVGYETQNWMTSPYWRPEAAIKVGLTTRHGSGMLYEQKFMYGYHNPFEGGTNLDAPKRYHFSSKKAMQSASDRTLIDGLKDSTRAIASAVRAKLAR